MKVRIRTNIRYQTTLLVAGAIFASCFLTACKEGNDRATASGNQIEEARVTSPDGRHDAVMTREAIGGSLGGVYWDVFIVPKGAVAPRDDKMSLLHAAVLRGEKLLWKQNHLLEVQYDIAHIEEFRNLWGSNEIEDRGWRKGDYLTEVRLVPSSPDFSFLTPDGGFKPTE
jgi:hypothetical protein